MNLELVIKAIDDASGQLTAVREQVEKLGSTTKNASATIASGFKNASNEVQKVSSRFVDLEIGARQARVALSLLGDAMGGTAQQVMGVAGRVADMLLSVNPLIMAIKAAALAMEGWNAALNAITPAFKQADQLITQIEKATSKLADSVDKYVDSKIAETRVITDTQKQMERAQTDYETIKRSLAELRDNIIAANDSWAKFFDPTHAFKVAQLASRYNELRESLSQVKEEMSKLEELRELERNQALLNEYVAAQQRLARSIGESVKEQQKAREVLAQRRAEEEKFDAWVRESQQRTLAATAQMRNMMLDIEEKYIRDAIAKEKELAAAAAEADAQRMRQLWAAFSEGEEESVRATLARFEEQWGGFISTVQGAQSVITNVWLTFRQGVGDAVAAMIVHGQSLMDSIKSLAQNILSMIISALVQMGIERLALAMIFKTTTATEASSRLAALAAETYAAAFASTVGIPMVGPFMAPGVAAAALATMLGGATAAGATGGALGSSIAGVFHGGIDYVPREASYILARGERVLSAEQNRDLTNYLRKEARAPTIGNINIMPGATVDSALLEKPESWWTNVVTRKVLGALNKAGRKGYGVGISYRANEEVRL